jgi:hypothetical protein
MACEVEAEGDGVSEGFLEDVGKENGTKEEDGRYQAQHGCEFWEYR